jgi:hypothetical protein
MAQAAVVVLPVHRIASGQTVAAVTSVTLFTQRAPELDRWQGIADTRAHWPGEPALSSGPPLSKVADCIFDGAVAGAVGVRHGAQVRRATT